MPTLSAVIKWTSNTEELRRELQAGTDQLVVLQKAAERTQRNLGGEGLMRAAHNAAAAVQNLGGVTKLTGAEQDRVNNLLGRAIEKYNALGQQAPTALRTLYDETKRVKTVTEDLPAKTSAWTSSLMGLGAAMGVTFSVGAVVAFGKELLHAGDEIQKMADKTGLTTEQVQKLDYVASQSGTTIDAMVNAVQNLEQRLGDNDKGAIGALDKLGINIEDLLKLNPHDQIVRIAEALSKVGDRSQFAALGADIFGKSWKEIAPAVLADMKQLEDEAPIMADSTVKSLDAAGDALDRFWRMVKSNAANQIGLAILSIENLPKAAGRAFGAMHMDVDKATKDIKDLVGWWDVLIQRVEKPPKVGISQSIQNLFGGGTVPKVKLTPDDISGIEADLNSQRKALDEAARAADAHAKAIKALSDAYNGGKAIRDANDALEAYTANEKRGVDVSKMTYDQVISLNKTLASAIDVYQELGREAPAELQRVYEQTQRLVDAQDDAKLSLEDWNETIRRHNEEQKAGEQASLEAIEAAEKQRFDDAKAALEDWDETVRRHNEEQKSGESETLGMLEDRAKAAVEHAREIQRALDDVAHTLHTVGGAFNNLFGQIISGAGDVVDGINNIASATTSLGKIASAIDLGVSLGKKLQPLLGLRHGKLGELLGTNASGREAILEFAVELTGTKDLDKLHELLQRTLPDDAERFWILLSQGTGRANVKQALANIQQVRDALPKNGLGSLEEQAAAAGFETQAELQKRANDAVKIYEYIRDSGRYSAETVQKAWERANDALVAAGDQSAVAAKKSADVIKSLQDELDSFSASLQAEADAPEYDEMGNRIYGVVELQQMARKKQLEEQIAAQKAARDAEIKASEEARAAEIDAKQDTFDAMLEAGTVVNDRLRDLFGEPLKIPYEFVALNRPEFTGDSANVSTGGYVTPTGVLQYAARGLFVPRGTDTVPAMLTPGEGVLNLDAMALLGRAALHQLNTGTTPAALKNPELSKAGTEGSSLVIQRGAFEGVFKGATISSPDLMEQYVDQTIDLIKRGGQRRTRLKQALGV